MHCTRVGCYWRRVGGTLGRWGLRAVRTTRGQWISTLVEQADPGQLGPTLGGTGVESSPPYPSADGGQESVGDGPMTEAPGTAASPTDSLLRGPVSTALTLPSLPPKRPAGIVEIMRFLSGVPRRYAFNVSSMDTRSSSQTAPHRPRPHRLQGPSPPHRPRTLEEAARPRRPPCAPRVRGGSGPDGAPASHGVPAAHQARR